MVARSSPLADDAMTKKAQPPDLLERLDAGLARSEAALLILIAAIMIILSTAQLVLRKTIDVGFEWADIVVRQMVLWLGFVGGSLATHEGRHIAIDALTKLMPTRLAAAVRVTTSLGAVVISGIMVYASGQFLASEVDAGSKAFGAVPAWLFEAIIPVAFAAITFHFAVAARRDVLVALGRREAPTEEASAEDGETST